MEPEYLLDSNAVIDFLAQKLPASGMASLSAIVDRTPRISVIAQIEVLRFNDTPENERILAEFVDSSLVYRPDGRACPGHHSPLQAAQNQAPRRDHRRYGSA